jgi:hypothetical protein
MMKKANRKAPILPDSEQAEPLPPPGEREKRAITDSAERVKNRRPRLSLKLNTKEDGRTLEIRPRHSDVDGWVARIRDAFGTTSLDFANSELSKLANALTPSGGVVSEQTENAILAVIDGARPCNEIEAMLVGQMAVTHAFALELMGRAKRVEEIQQFDSAGNMMVKLLRTFVMQAEALAKLRRGGEQTVRVEHVHVYPGGQAVVGNVTTQPGGGGAEENGGQAHAANDPRALAIAPGSPVWSADAEREALPVTSGERQEKVPNARRRKR